MKKTITIILITFVCSLLIFSLLQRHSFKIVQTWEQPENITYDDWGPYYLHVVSANRDLGFLPFSMPRNYFLYAGRDKSEISYGHFKKYSFEYNQDIVDYLQSCSVKWDKEGATFTEPSGHSFFIPSKSFIGGR